MFFFVADWHALTTHYEDTSSVAENTLQIAMDWLSVGLDPNQSTIFVQSSVLEHAELHLLLSMISVSSLPRRFVGWTTAMVLMAGLRRAGGAVPSCVGPRRSADAHGVGHGPGSGRR